jgi:hypothetical protein
MMKLAALVLSVCALTPAIGQTQLGVSIGISQPGVYGRIDIGSAPPRLVLSPQPIGIVPSPIATYRQPIYLYVAPGHQRRWAKYCARYQACGQPVYFVQEQWVREHAAPPWSAPARQGHGDGDKHGRRHGHKHGGD